MREKATRDTENSFTGIELIPQLKQLVYACFVSWYLSLRWLWSPRSSQELWGKHLVLSPESELFSLIFSSCLGRALEL